MAYTIIITEPIFGKNEIKIWASSKQSYNKYFSKVKEMYNFIMNSEFDISIKPIEHIEIIRANIKFYFKSNITTSLHDYILLVPGDFDHSVTGEKSQKVTRENDQKSHLTPLIIQFPEDCQKQFLPFL